MPVTGHPGGDRGTPYQLTDFPRLVAGARQPISPSLIWAALVVSRRGGGGGLSPGGHAYGWTVRLAPFRITERWPPTFRVRAVFLFHRRDAYRARSTWWLWFPAGDCAAIFSADPKGSFMQAPLNPSWLAVCFERTPCVHQPVIVWKDSLAIIVRGRCGMASETQFVQLGPRRSWWTPVLLSVRKMQDDEAVGVAGALRTAL